MQLRLHYKEVLKYLAILWIILSSGSMYFTIMNVMINLFVFLGIGILTILVLKIDGKTLKKNLLNFGIIMLIVLLNLFINSEYSVIDNDLIILLIRLISLIMIQTTLTKVDFAVKFVKIMTLLAVVSLICFAITMAGLSLPGQIVESRNGLQYFYTFYHTVGYRTIYQRNAGIFWEAPAYAIFLNMAIVYLVTYRDMFKRKFFSRSLVILIITVCTTLSTIAYICLGIVLIYVFLSLKKNPLINNNMMHQTEMQESSGSKRKIIIYAIVLAGIALLVYMENRFSIISYKLINRGASYTTRTNDTYMSVLLAMRRPFFGYGVFNDYSVYILQTMGVVNNSSGLGAMLVAWGIPVTILYFIKSLRGISEQLGKGAIRSLLILALMLIFHSSEHLWLYTFFMTFLLSWKESKREAI